MKKLFNLLIVAFMSATLLSSCTLPTIEPGEEGFMFRPWSSGVDTSMTYKEGTQVVAMWNDMIIYNVLQQSSDYNSSVMEKNGMEIGVDITINFNPMRGKTHSLHLKHGIDYNFCEIADVDLPNDVKKAITAKEEQKQKNQRAKELEQEQEFIANAKIKEAEGNKQKAILEAEGKAKSIELVNRELSRSPDYVSYVKWKGYADGKGSPYGQNNVFSFGSGGNVGVFKNFMDK
jgi:regulator of protease activity HflC (stomatin/prohibitin superfamily)